MKRFPLVMSLLLFFMLCGSLRGETWFVRKDGGTRFTAKMPQGECDGRSDKPYAGRGINQHCAFKDVRYLWTDGSYTTVTTASAGSSYGWVGSGGDTYVVRDGPWRVGQSGPNPKDGFGLYGNPYGASAPPLPAGSPGHLTRLLGEHFESCGDGQKTQLFGGFGVGSVLDLQTAYVEVKCIELTRHSQCIRAGVPAAPPACHTDFPLDDYASNGIVTGVATHDLLLENVWVHGFTNAGITGAIGGLIIARRVDIAYNGAAGWDFDDGRGTPMRNGELDLDQVTVEWSGCNQAYPGIGAASCYSQSTGGYGDGIGTPAGTCLTAKVDRSLFRYNTQDGFDLLHNDTGNCSLSITNSSSYGNNGAQFKWGANDNPVLFTNNVVIGNCRRLSAAMPGEPADFNQHLQDFCRAEDAMAFNMHQNATVTMRNNTVVSYEPTTIDIDCVDKNCSDAKLSFTDNVALGYDNPATYSGGGQKGGPGLFYFGHPIGQVVRAGNVIAGFRNHPCLTVGHHFDDACVDPKFVGEPHLMQEQDLDSFNIKRLADAPKPQAGAHQP